MATNTGRYKTFQNAQALHGPAGGGQNLNEDLQKRQGDDLDGLMGALIGDGVVTGWLVSAGSGLAVNLTAGEGLAGGQRCKSTGTGAVSSLPASTGLIRIYVTAATPWDGASATWPTTFGFTTGALGAGQLLLAEVATDGAGVTAVTDKRVFLQPQPAALAAPNDATAPAAAATSLLQRLSMFATQIKAIVGGADWFSAIPQSLTALTGFFHPSTGHTHDGTGTNAPKVLQVNSHESPDTDGAPTALHHTLGTGANQAAAGNHTHAAAAIAVTPGGTLAADDVQEALLELDSEKAAVGHTHAAGDITSGAFPAGRLGTGTPTEETLVFGDGAWKQVSRVFGPSYLINGDFGLWLHSGALAGPWTTGGAGILTFRESTLTRLTGAFALGILPIPVTTANTVTNGSSTDSQSYNTASISPPANQLMLAWIGNTKASGGPPDTPTLSGNGLTWVQVATVVDASNLRRLTLFRAKGSSPSTGAVTITVPGSGNTSCQWSIQQYANVNQGGTNGSAAVKQSTTAAIGALQTAPISLTGRNIAAGFFQFGFNGAPAGVRLGHSQQGSNNQQFPSTCITTSWIGRPDTAASIQWPDTSSTLGGTLIIAVEVDHDAAASVAAGTFYATQNAANTPGMPALAAWQGKPATAGAWVYATAANTARVGLADGTGTTWSAYHTGNSTWQFLSVTRTIDGGASAVRIRLACDSNSPGYFQSAAVVFGTVLGDYAPPTWPLPRVAQPAGGDITLIEQVLPRKSVVSSLVAVAAGVSGTVTLRLTKNGVGQDLWVTYSGAGTFVNQGDGVEFAAGDVLDFTLTADFGGSVGTCKAGYAVTEIP